MSHKGKQVDPKHEGRRLPGARTRMERILHSRWMLGWLGLMSFLENTVLMFAVEPLFIPIMLGRAERIFMIAFVLLLGCIAGSLAVYFAAAALYEPVVMPFLTHFELMDEFAAVREQLRENGFWMLVLIGFMPIPYQLATVSAGLMEYPLQTFLAAVIVGRGIRYFGLAFVLRWLGHRAPRLLERYQLEIGIAFLVLVIGLSIWSYVR